MNGISSLGPWLEQFVALPAVAILLVKVSMLLASAWLAHALLWRANPRWRVLVWRGSVVGLLLVTFLHTLAPPLEFRVVTTSLEIANDSTADFASSFPTGDFADPRMPSLPETLAIDETATALAEAATVATSKPLGPIAQGWPWIILAVWSGGCLCCFFRMALGLNRIRSLVSGSQSVRGGASIALDRVADDLAVVTKPRLRVSSQVSAPVLCGLSHTALLVPSRMLQPSRANQWPAVFAHEISHLRSRDLGWNLLLHVISILLWFHPLAWFARAAHASVCESVSDAVAAGYIGDVRSYSQTLAQVALDAQAPPALSLSMARASEVQRRVQALRRQVFAHELRRPVTRVALVTGLLLAGSLGGLKIVHAEVIGEGPSRIADAQHAEAQEKTSATDVDAAAAQETVQERADNRAGHPTVSAIDKALTFLAARQRADGSFGDDERANERLAITAVCGMALLSAGSLPDNGPFDAQIQQATDYVLDHVQEGGLIASSPGAAPMYVHAYALRFLAENHLAHPSPKTEKAIAQSVELIVKSQNAMNGWRYIPSSRDADSSVTACQIVALQAARRAGARVPRETIDRAIGYLKRCQKDDGGFAYIDSPGSGSSVPRSAAVMSALYLSNADDARMLAKGLTYLNDNAGEYQVQDAYFFYAQYHLSTAMNYAGDEHFRRWYARCRDYLLTMQAADGSWSHPQLGSEYSTAKACIILLSPRQPVIRLSRG